MPIRVRCPNPECNRLLNVPDRLAGKGCRCPGCKTEIRVPAPAAPEEDILEIDEEAAPPQPPRQVRQAAPPRRRRRDEEDDEDEDGEEAGDEVRPRSPLVKNPANTVNCILFGAGIVFLLGLAVVPWLPWISVTSDIKLKKDNRTDATTVSGMGHAVVAGSGRNGTLEGAARPDGLFFLILAVLLSLAVAVGAGVALSGVLGQRGSWQVAAILSLAGEACGILFLCWLLAWIWKIVTLSEVIRKWVDTTVRFGPGGGQVTCSTFPGLGLFVGLVLAVAAAYIFSQLSARLVRRSTAYLADLTGLALGGLVLALLVRPWNAQALFEGLLLYLPLS